METNIVRLIFIFASIFTGSLGVLLNYIEPYLPTLITRTYRYGKFASNDYQPIVTRVEVPKRWFRHFYIFAAPTSSYVLYLVMSRYFLNIKTSKHVMWILDMCLGSFREPLVSPESTFIATVLLTLHCWKRLYETQYINIFSDRMMNISHYLIGLYHYAGTLMSIIGESVGFAEGSEPNFSWSKITFSHLLCSIIFIISSYMQFNTNFILRKLRKNGDGKTTNMAYKVPHEGLFAYISGALQFTEIIIYMMLYIILWPSTTYPYVMIWVLVNQVSTAVLTHKWYMQTFTNYPKSRKILIPFVF